MAAARTAFRRQSRAACARIRRSPSRGRQARDAAGALADSLFGPHQNLQAEYWVGNGRAVKRTGNTFLTTLNNLHRGVGMNLGWVLLMDTIALADPAVDRRAAVDRAEQATYGRRRVGGRFGRRGAGRRLGSSGTRRPWRRVRFRLFRPLRPSRTPRSATAPASSVIRGKPQAAGLPRSRARPSRPQDRRQRYVVLRGGDLGEDRDRDFRRRPADVDAGRPVQPLRSGRFAVPLAPCRIVAPRERAHVERGRLQRLHQREIVELRSCGAITAERASRFMSSTVSSGIATRPARPTHPCIPRVDRTPSPVVGRPRSGTDSATTGRRRSRASGRGPWIVTSRSPSNAARRACAGAAMRGRSRASSCA